MPEPSGESASLTWVERTFTVDAIDPAKDAIEANPGWRLLHVGMGSGGQTTLTYGWPWSAPSDMTEGLRDAIRNALIDTWDEWSDECGHDYDRMTEAVLNMLPPAALSGRTEGSDV